MGYIQILDKGPEFVERGRIIPEEAYTRKKVDIHQSDIVRYFILLELLGRWGARGRGMPSEGGGNYKVNTRTGEVSYVP